MKDYLNYWGSTCVVTGTASGIGKATATILAELGADIVSLDLNNCDVPGIMQHIPVDFADKTSIDKAFAQVPGRIDKFFGIAGVFGFDHDFLTAFTINFVANKYMAEEYVIPRLTKGEHGAIAFMASVGGARWREHMDEYRDLVEPKSWDGMVAAIKAKPIDGMAGQEQYMLAKRCINYYMKTRSPELARNGNRINTVSPHYTETPMLEAIRVAAKREGRGDPFDSKGAFERIGTPEDAAKAIVFLNSDMAMYITGHILYEEGGMQAMIETGLMPMKMDAGYFK